MADEADQAQSISEKISEANLYRSRRDEPMATATGFCLFCDEPVELGRRWCCPECRDDWEREQ